MKKLLLSALVAAPVALMAATPAYAWPAAAAKQQIDSYRGEFTFFDREHSRQGQCKMDSGLSFTYSLRTEHSGRIIGEGCWGWTLSGDILVEFLDGWKVKGNHTVKRELIREF